MAHCPPERIDHSAPGHFVPFLPPGKTEIHDNLQPVLDLETLLVFVKAEVYSGWFRVSAFRVSAVSTPRNFFRV